MKLSFSTRILTCNALLLLLVACGGEAHESSTSLFMKPASPPVADNVVELSGQESIIKTMAIANAVTPSNITVAKELFNL